MKYCSTAISSKIILVEVSRKQHRPNYCNNTKYSTVTKKHQAY